MADERRELEPHDRLTRMCDAMIDALEQHEEFQGDEKCIIFVTGTDEGERRGGLVLHGYGTEGDGEAISDMFNHLRAMVRVNGGELLVMPLNNG